MENLRKALRSSKTVRKALAELENIEFEMDQYYNDIEFVDTDVVEDLVTWVSTFNN